MVIGTWLLEKFRLDDAVGAVPVHGVAGMVGILATALFMEPEAIVALNEARVPLATKKSPLGSARSTGPWWCGMLSLGLWHRHDSVADH